MLENYIEILVVDDDPFIAKVLSGYLNKDNGFVPTFTDNGCKALDILKEKEFDVILTDIIMPTTNGIELIEAFRKFNKRTPIVAMSGGDFKNKADEMIDFAHYFANKTLQKPFTKEELIKCLEHVLKMRIPDVMKYI